MKQPWVLYLSDYLAVVFQAGNRVLREEACFSVEASGRGELNLWLKKNQPGPVHLLLDLRQEEYQVEQVPHTLGTDRQAMLRLRLSRAFGDENYTHAVIQGRGPETKNRRRPPDRALLMALNEPEAINPWIETLLAHKVPLRGIHSMPLLSQRLLKHLPITEYSLLVAHTPSLNHQNHEGLRQSYFLNKELAVSRLLPLSSLAPDEYCEYINWEVIKTQQYIVNLGLMPEDKVLRVILLGHEALLEHFRRYLSGHASLELDYQLLDIQCLVEALKLKSWPEPIYPHGLVAYQILRQGARNHYARTYEQRYFTHLQIRRGLIWSGVAVCLVSAGMAGENLLEAREHAGEASRLRGQIAAAELEYQQTLDAQRQKLGLDIDVVHIRDTVEAANYLMEHRYNPYRAIAILSRLLSNNPEVVLEEIVWKLSDPGNVMPDENKKKPPQRMGRLAALLQRRKQEQMSADKVEVLNITGHLEDYGGNAYRALKIVKDMVRELQATSGVRRVKEAELPMVVNPSESIRVELSQKKQQREAAFALEIVFHFKDERKKPAPPQT